MKDKNFKVLSIDGGGIKGLYTAKILAHLEEQYQCHLSEYFDLICGTSTGGLIALGLSIDIPASELVDFYKTHGPKIFRNRFPASRSFRLLQQVLFQSKYSGRNLKKALKAIYKDHTVGDAKTLLCIPSFNTTTGKNRVFKFDHKYLIGADNAKSMVDVGLATSAAPTYFPLHKIDTAYFVDGGVWANNPSLCGILEAIKYFKAAEYDYMSILSVSSLNHNSGFHLRERRIPFKWINPFNFKRWSFLNWNSRLFQVTLDGQSEFVHFFLDSVKPNLDFLTNYERIPSHEISPDNLSNIDLDKASKHSIELLSEYGDRQGISYRARPEIQEFFKTKKTVITKT